MSPRALVVGGAGAIGRAVCRRLAVDGYAVLVADLAGADAVAAGLPGEGHAHAGCDVTDLASVEALLDGPWAKPEAVVYAAGVNYTGPVATTDWQAYERLQAVNLRGAFHLGSVVARGLEAEPWNTSLVFLASVAGLSGEAGGSVYCSTKFGLIGFVQSFAAEIARFGSRANAVCPGNVDSELLTRLAEGVAEREGVDTETMLGRFAAASAFNRFISVDEVASACGFLLSGAASGISGQSIVVDGPPGDGTVPETRRTPE